MKRLALFSVLVSFLFCYLEWGGGNSAFIYEAAYQILSLQGDVIGNFSHPAILIPFCGQLIFLYLLFSNSSSKRLAWIGWSMMAILVLLLLVIGLMGQNFRIVLSTLPFLLSSWWLFRVWGKKSMS